ncbi:MAG: zinc ribbon domain-containing protein YjdM [Neptuniibacter sp.]
MSLPACPKCNSEFVYQDQEMLICPECAYEWNPSEEVADEEEVLIVKDVNGNTLEEGDKITLAMDRKVKGSSQVLKVGTKGVIKRIVEGDHELQCKVDGGGSGDMMLKGSVVKKA